MRTDNPTPFSKGGPRVERRTEVPFSLQLKFIFGTALMLIITKGVLFYIPVCNREMYFK